MKLELYYPTKPYVCGQKFGENQVSFYHELGLDGHNGLDLHAPDGWIVRAAHDGVVTFAGEDGSAGLGIVIRTTQTFDYKDGQAYYKTIYWHLKKGCLYKAGGDMVKAGDIIALADNTGQSTGAHLHLGLKPMEKGENEWTWWNTEQNNGYKGAINPEPFFNGFHAADAHIVTKITEGLALAWKKAKDLHSAISGLLPH
jgi:murein DD-endopeptidase MepM/ murein hydrolase activator NlpD